MKKSKTDKTKKVNKKLKKKVGLSKDLIYAGMIIGIVAIGVEVYKTVKTNRAINKLTNKQLDCLKYIIKNKILRCGTKLFYPKFHPSTLRSLLSKGLIKVRVYSKIDCYVLSSMALVLKEKIIAKK